MRRFVQLEAKEQAEEEARRADLLLLGPVKDHYRRPPKDLWT